MTQIDDIPLAEAGGPDALSDAEMCERAKAFYALVARRRSVRAFAPDPVPREVIETCVRAAGTSPSGANHQPWFFALVGEKAIKAKIRAAAEEEERAFYAERASGEWLDALAPLGTDAVKPYLELAPWLIVIFAQRRGGPEAGDDKKNYYVNESVGIASGMLITALHQAGLATLTHTPAPMTFLNEILDRPQTEKPFLILVTGKPAPDARVPVHALQKKAFEEIAKVY